MALTSSIVVTRSPELAVKGTELASLLDVCLLSLCMLAMLFCPYAIQTVSSLRASRRRLADTARRKDHLRSLLDAPESGHLAAIAAGMQADPVSARSGTSIPRVEHERAVDQVA